ncbi:transmembrane protein 100-like [Hemiscyllium ocellatum]|uniref:transmembrane protein 100-like n=1 Tax=Hemiscyllium ocellatum TaxID=170820 RepID=UPI0029676174|nr:transmembrane protein 100-like [Hemiscyllium ocellatum]
MKPDEGPGRVVMEMGDLPAWNRDPAAKAREATGGLERSCARCLLPWGALLLVVGASVLALGYATSEHGSVLPSLGLAVTGAAAAILLASLASWRLQLRRKARRRGSLGTLVVGSQE